MNQGIKTVLYPVKDMARAKALFKELLGVEPYSDAAYYVGFKVGDQDIGLVPQGSNEGVTAYYYVDDIHRDLQLIEDSGGQVVQKARDVGAGRLVASAKDAEGNLIGLIQDT